MADEVILEYLHLEIVNYIYRSSEKPDQDNCISKLESIGYRIGQSLVERFTKDGTRFKDELDTMKFICKDLWNSVYKKQIDNLRTNHQGVYVLQDNKFRFLTQLSNGKQYMDYAPKIHCTTHVLLFIQDIGLSVGDLYVKSNLHKIHSIFYLLALPCGLMRGALANLGINSIVTAEVTAMPACKFQIQIQRS